MSTDKYVKGECRSCAGHLEFPAHAAGEVIPCPHCGRPTELVCKPAARRRWFGVLIFAVLLAGGAAAVWVLFGKQTPPVPLRHDAAGVQPAKPSPPADEFVTNDFSISAVKLEKAAGGSLVYVTGKVRNLAERQRFGVKVEFSLLDSNSAPAGKATDYNRSLEPNGIWNFKALALDSRAAVVRLNSITEAP